MPDRVTAVLLGAGASKEAGVPLTSEMTRLVVEGIQEDSFARWDKTAAVLNFVCGTIIGYDSSQGGNPFEGVDIERLFSAVQLLADRRELEVTPFVSAWHPSVEAVDRHPWPSFFEKNFQEAVLGKFGNKAENLIREAIRAETGVGDGTVYRHLLSQMTMALRKLVYIGEPALTDYLLPLFDLSDLQGRLVVGTLNYDLAMETCAGRNDKKLETGMGHWARSRSWAVPTEGVFLLKLHGSIDWCMEQHHAGEGKLSQLDIALAEDPQNDQREPAIVFGQRGKLRAQGPFLELLAHFAVELEKANRLVVIGYSFRDDHINEQIRRWMNADMSRHLIVVDPHFPDGSGFGSHEDFRHQMLWGLNPSDLPGKPPAFDARLTVIRESTSAGLEKSLA
ncbi:MAG: SIR2 family protein [Actinomycetota bacterium]|nr:SIR2 family protein [Actinomycetota bacterium]